MSFSTISSRISRGSGKPLFLKELRGEQQRQLIDTNQVFESWRLDQKEDRRLSGSMNGVLNI
jgi:hypothetical protein